MYKLLVSLSFILLGGCAIYEPEAEQVVNMASGNGSPRLAAVNHLTQQLVNELVRQNAGLEPSQPLLVSTPVMLEDMKTTDALGLQIQQGLIVALHGHQFNLVDINVGEDLRVTPQGDFILTRNWQQLPSDVSVEHLVVSTMSRAKDGISLNVRIVNVSNNRVVSACQSFIQAEDLPGYVTLSEKVVSQDGLLYRDSSRGRRSVSVVGDKS